MSFGDGRLPERFWDKISPEPTTGCWLWGGTGDRYGHFRVGRKMLRAHRVAYTALVGEIPAGLVVDHACNTTMCCNPDHLRCMTQFENTQRVRGVRRASRVSCKRGHSYPENERHYRGWVTCGECARLQTRRWRERCAVIS